MAEAFNTVASEDPGLITAMSSHGLAPLTLQQLSDIIASLPEEGRPGRVTGDRLLTTIEELKARIKAETEGTPFKPLSLPRMLSLRPGFRG